MNLGEFPGGVVSLELWRPATPPNMDMFEFYCIALCVNHINEP